MWSVWVLVGKYHQCHQMMAIVYQTIMNYCTRIYKINICLFSLLLVGPIVLCSCFLSIVINTKNSNHYSYVYIYTYIFIMYTYTCMYILCLNTENTCVLLEPHSFFWMAIQGYTPWRFLRISDINTCCATLLLWWIWYYHYWLSYYFIVYYCSYYCDYNEYHDYHDDHVTIIISMNVITVVPVYITVTVIIFIFLSS